jgi:hypothetical protein
MHICISGDLQNLYPLKLTLLIINKAKMKTPARLKLGGFAGLKGQAGELNELKFIYAGTIHRN